MSEGNNDVSASELLLGMVVMGAALLFCAAWCGGAVECERKTCPPGQEPEMVRSYSSLSGAACACVLR